MTKMMTVDGVWRAALALALVAATGCMSATGSSVAPEASPNATVAPSNTTVASSHATDAVEIPDAGERVSDIDLVVEILEGGCGGDGVARISNIGTDDAISTFIVSGTVSGFDPRPVKKTVHHVEGLAAGKSVDLKFSNGGCGDNGQESCIIHVQIDISNVVPEGSEANNDAKSKCLG